MVRHLRAALIFLTRVPIGIGRGPSPSLSATVPWFPVAGLLIGAVGGGVFAAMSHLSTPAIAAAVATTSLVLLTGAFHLDGLGDVADAFAGGQTTERRLEIMKDSRLGTYGVAALVLVLLIQLTALSSLNALSGFAALVIAHCLARSSAIWLMAFTPPARQDGLGVDYLARLTTVGKFFGGLLGPVAAVTLAGLPGLAAVGFCVLTAVILRRWSLKAIEGFSGDVLGAIEQINEALILVVLASFFVHGHAIPWWT